MPFAKVMVAPISRPMALNFAPSRHRIKFHASSRRYRGRLGPRASKDNDDASSADEAKYAALGAAGLAAEAVVFQSLSFVRDNGCGLGPGPYGLLSLAEGLSYLAVAGLLGASAISFAKDGTGLPTGRPGYELGPGALLGLAEGVAYLYLAGGLIALVAALVLGVDAVLPLPVEGGPCGEYDRVADAAATKFLDPCTYAPWICIR
ncbi:hypothetical protein CYMTET_41588 [Cymbomonas tetramitiformis]|uniref:Uncharacterized protein n=1 Tax=Cymbomonas tetramitiformis TaxID=36881 RepID=A0AAE0C7X1_9CHLO|nr:hypothetical protein CYMTET_41588 [Cymbomonas tetramitiformis]